MAMIRVISFDAVGTLMDADPPVEVVYTRTAHRYGARIPPAVLRKRLRESMAAASPPAHRGNRRDGFRFAFRWWKRVVRATLEPWFSDSSLLDRMFRDLFEYFASPSAWRVYPDVIPALTRWRSMGRTTVIVSNFDTRIYPILEAHGLDPLFDRIFLSTEIGYAKPDPETFRQVARMLDAQPREILHLGDSLRDDYEAARAAGLHALLMNRKSRLQARDVPSIHTLEDLTRPMVASGFSPGLFPAFTHAAIDNGGAAAKDADDA